GPLRVRLLALPRAGLCAASPLSPSPVSAPVSRAVRPPPLPCLGVSRLRALSGPSRAACPSAGHRPSGHRDSASLPLREPSQAVSSFGSPALRYSRLPSTRPRPSELLPRCSLLPGHRSSGSPTLDPLGRSPSWSPAFGASRHRVPRSPELRPTRPGGPAGPGRAAPPVPGQQNSRWRRGATGSPCRAGSVDLREGPQVQLDDLRVVQQLAAGARVGVAALVEHVTPVGDLQAAARVLLDHHDRDAAGVDLLHLLEDLVLELRRQARRRLVQHQHRRV